MRKSLPLLLIALLAAPALAQDAPAPAGDLAAYLRGYELEIELLREKAALADSDQGKTLNEAIEVAKKMQRAAERYTAQQRDLALKRLTLEHEWAKLNARHEAEARQTANESQAIQSLRALVTAQDRFGSEGSNPAAPGGTKQGYRFELEGGEGSSRGAKPIPGPEGTGDGATREFFVDENGVIRFKPKETPKAEALEPLVVTFTLGPSGETSLDGKPLEGTLDEAIAKLTPGEGQGVSYRISAAASLKHGQFDTFTEKLMQATSKAGHRFEQLIIVPPGTP
ncbi:MAG: hypothetical protein ACYTFT_17340 [Planctomycetota bacterium]|jgi:hypothetical protein